MSRGRIVVRALALAACAVAFAQPARAQAFISPFIGHNFGDDAVCPVAVTTCVEHNPTIGVSFGNINALIGFEEDFSYSKNLFKDGSTDNSSVVTLMSNVIVGPPVGKYVRPYGVGGFGMMRARAQFGPSPLEITNSDIGWNVGGGIMVTHTHIGIRADVRFFHGFNDLDVLGFPVSNLKLDYGRAIIGLVVQ